MEHATLHALQLCGTVAALGGSFLVLVILLPARGALERNFGAFCGRCSLPLRGGEGRGEGASDSRDLGQDAPDPQRRSDEAPLLEAQAFGEALLRNASRWTAVGAMVAAAAALATLLVDVAEVQGRTVFGGVEWAMVGRFAQETAVGRFLLGRTGLLLLAAFAARLPGRIFKWWLVAACSGGAVVCTSFVSHAAAQPEQRAWALAGQIAHIGAAGAWIGVLIQLLAARPLIVTAASAGETALLAEMVRRFAPIGLTGCGLLGLSGLYGVYRFVAELPALPASAYGLTLFIKLLLLAPLLYAGWLNYRIISPALRAQALKGQAADAALRLRFGRTLELEVTAGILLITVAGILGSIPPPGEDGSGQLTPIQARLLFSPDLPTTAIVNPASFYGSPMRTLDDLRYSEFMHNWSGVMVFLLGLCWLAQSFGRGKKPGGENSLFRLPQTMAPRFFRERIGIIGGRTWPWLMVPFGVFIVLAADPEVWLLRRVSLGQALADPQLLEHQIGAIMVLVLAWLGWRDLRRPAETRPLGYKLPVLMILGSVLLLGHAHSTLSATADLTSLINVQHAVIGGLGLLAGTIRWLELRGLVALRLSRFLWPSLVIGLGMFMAFFYREVV